MASKWRRCLPAMPELCRWLQHNDRLVVYHSCRSLSVSPTLRLFCVVHNRFQDNRFNACDITSSEALRALRPFYLAVHPDRFVQFPRERTTNEDSLKKLNSYLDALESGCGQGHSTTHSLRPKPIHLTFFVRRRKSENLTSVSVSLNAYSIGSAIHDILQSCDLFADINNPTASKLIKTKHQESQKHRVLSTYNRYRSQKEPIQDYPDFDYAFSERRMHFAHEHRKQPESLEIWLSQNLSLARSRLDLSKTLTEENRLLIEKICSRYKVQSVKVDSDWTAATVKGHLLCLEKTLSCINVADLAAKSDGRLRFVLSHSSRVSLEREVELSCEDTVQQWLHYLTSSALTDLSILKEIDSLEKELLDMITREYYKRHDDGGNRVILKRPSSLTPADYKNLLTEYVRHCSEKATYFPYNHPGNAAAATLCDHKVDCSDSVVVSIVTKSKKGVAMPFLVDDGSVEIPLHCPLQSLVDYCLQHCREINGMREKHKRSRDEMLQSVETCRDRLHLSELTLKANISNEQIKNTCRRLLQLVEAGGDGGKENGDIIELKGHRLCLASSFSVSSDGKLKIPWDFKIT